MSPKIQVQASATHNLIDFLKPHKALRVNMSDLDKNIHRKEEPSPYAKITVNPIEKDKEEKEARYKGLRDADESQTFAALLSYFKKILSSSPFKEKGQGALFDQFELLDKVLAFRTLLLLLSKEDLSHNPDFTLQLSLLWHALLDDFKSLPRTSDDSSDTFTQIKFFIDQIQNYPLGADHTLGYYFTEYAGKEWIPFPFMELLQRLHEEFNASPSNSTLGNWITLLNDLLP